MASAATYKMGAKMQAVLAAHINRRAAAKAS